MSDHLPVSVPSPEKRLVVYPRCRGFEGSLASLRRSPPSARSAWSTSPKVIEAAMTYRWFMARISTPFGTICLADSFTCGTSRRQSLICRIEIGMGKHGQRRRKKPTPANGSRRATSCVHHSCIRHRCSTRLRTRRRARNSNQLNYPRNTCEKQVIRPGYESLRRG
jgi:hypothetical protein